MICCSIDSTGCADLLKCSSFTLGLSVFISEKKLVHICGPCCVFYRVMPPSHCLIVFPSFASVISTWYQYDLTFFEDGKWMRQGVFWIFVCDAVTNSRVALLFASSFQDNRALSLSVWGKTNGNGWLKV